MNALAVGIIGPVIAVTGVAAATHWFNSRAIAWIAGIVGVVAVAAALLAWISVGVHFGAERECNTYHATTGRLVRLAHSSPFTWTCFAEVRGEWYPIDQIYSEEPG